MKVKRAAALLLAFIICFSVISPSAFATRDTSLEQELATDLKSLSLFKGVSNTNFDLNRAPTRTEAIVMLIRVLGKENAALNGSWTHPFKDVAPWANKYVGYAYQNGLSKGVSATQFGSGNATAATYLTFVLRALGYSDANGADFTWDNPYTLARSINILPNKVDTSEFWRSDVVLISYSALPIAVKGSSQSLCDKLIADGVFTKQLYDTYYDAKAISSASSKTVLSAEEVYSKCSPAVFYIETYNASGKTIGTGSGFFVDSQGTAFTNYHVIEKAVSAKITVSDSNKVYDVKGVYDYNKDQDWAVLKIDGSGFSYLKKGDSTSAVGGATVYAIGSPLGLQNTITQGLISNPKRTEDNVNYIQISAAISPGSSGGALINKYGEVIGITSASYVYGQNLNLALPLSYLLSVNTSTVKSIVEVTGASTTANPYQDLKDALKAEGNYDSELGGYILNYYTNTTDYLLVYKPNAEDDLFLMSDTVEDGMHTNTIIYLYPGDTAYYDVLLYDPKINGYDTFAKSSFNSKTALAPSSYTGDASYRSDFNELCSYEVACLLAMCEYMLEDSAYPVTIDDLGFKALYQELLTASTSQLNTTIYGILNAEKLPLN